MARRTLAALALAGAIFWCAPAAADHRDGAYVRIVWWCETPDDVRAYALSGFPNPIPDDIDCWFPNEPVTTVLESTGDEVQARTGATAGIYTFRVFLLEEGEWLVGFTGDIEPGRGA